MLKDEIVTAVNRAGKSLAVSEIQRMVKVEYPISTQLRELADDKRIRRIKRGVYAPIAAPVRNGKTSLQGMVRIPIRLELDDDVVRIEVGSRTRSIPLHELLRLLDERE